MDSTASAPIGDSQKTSTEAASPAVTIAKDAPAATTTAADEPVPDPDEDDLDDLDDMLDDFSSVNVSGKQAQPAAPASTSGPGRPATAEPATNAAPSAPSLSAEAPLPGGAEDFSEEEFQKQLQAGMAELMSDLESSPDMQKQFESIFKGLGAAATPDAPISGAPTAGAATAATADANAEASFQETIRRTMERMQTSGDEATAAAASKGGVEDDFIAEMMKAMKDMPSGGGEGGEEDFSKMLMGMMEQLTNKDILYEPMKELHDKFPDWMEKNKDKVSAEDKERYELQQTLVKEMVEKFEEPKYADSNAADREYIVDRMQKMQAAGSPPPDLVGDMPSAKDVLDGPDESCTPQ